MKPISKLLIASLAAVALAVSSNAASVSWGSWTEVVDNTAIQTLGGYTTYGGMNFSGSTTTINNGSLDVTFTGIAQNASGTAAGITVGTSGFDFASTGSGNSNVVSAVGSPQTWGAVLDRVIGDFGSGAAATFTLSGLTAGSGYYVQFFSSAPDGNILANSKITSGDGDSPFFGNHAGGGTKSIIATFTADGTSQAFTISGTEPTYSALVIGVQPAGGPDTTPPEWTATWPQAEPLSSTSFTVRAKTNEAGKAYFVVLPDGATAPSAAQVKAGTDSGNTPVSASGSMALTANTEAAAIVGSLSPIAAYDVYFVAEDGVPNLQSSPTKVDATTPAPDITAPTWTATWPKAAPLSPTSLTVRAQTNETGNAYYVVLAAGATAPSAAQVKAGTDSGDAPALKSGSLALTANTEAVAPVTGLTTDTTYDVYFAAEDAVPNLQAGPSMVSVSLVSPAVVTWGAVQALTGATDIASTGVSGLAGANFGITTGTTTIVNNGAGETGGVDVEFKSLRSGQNATLSNGINVAAASAWGNWGTAVGNSAVTGNFGIVLDSNLGIEAPGPAAADITLSGLAIGTTYKIQFFADSTGNNSQTISGSNAMNTLNGQFVTGSFTANATSLVLTVARTTDFGVANALTIGVATGGGTTFADWIGGYDGLNGLTGFNDDADFDGLDNGLENFLGTSPNAGNAGLTAGTLSGNTFTFTHPQNATPASDLSAPVYTWSTDLQTFHASGAFVGGITVALMPSPNTPSAGTTTVTATITGTIPPKLFVRLGVTQQ